MCFWCVYVCVENFPEFCQCSAIASLSFPPPPWGPCVVLGAPAAAPGQLDSQFSSTADVVVALPATLAVCCSPTGRTTTAPSPQLEGNQIQFMAERAREFCLVVVVVRLFCCCWCCACVTFVYIFVFQFRYDTHELLLKICREGREEKSEQSLTFELDKEINNNRML